MRIAFTGAAGTGKSTLTEWVAAEYGLPINPVGSRSVAAAMGFSSPYDVDKAGKRVEFQERLMSEKIAWEAAHDSFVTDRALIDNLTYTSLHAVREVTEEMLRRTFQGYLRYTRVFFCPMAMFHKTGSDPMRVHDRAYHHVFEALLQGYLIEAQAWCGARPKGIWHSGLEGRKDFVKVGLL